MLFFSFFKTLVGKEVSVELKNDINLKGTLHSVDQYLNVKLTDVSVINLSDYPQLGAVKDCFLRGSAIRYIDLNKADVQISFLEDASRREANKQKKNS